jgi:hypothetical protein
MKTLMLVLAVVLMPLEGLAQSGVRCVDANGNVHYGRQPPPGVTCNATSEVSIPNAPIPSKADSALAIANCKAAVLEELKAPATARFARHASYDPSEAFAVVGEVDSQNSYGALMRGVYGCRMIGARVDKVEISTRR